MNMILGLVAGVVIGRMTAPAEKTAHERLDDAIENLTFACEQGLPRLREMHDLRFGPHPNEQAAIQQQQEVITQQGRVVYRSPNRGRPYRLR